MYLQIFCLMDSERQRLRYKSIYLIWARDFVVQTKEKIQIEDSSRVGC
jgi:hypothetical protein